MEWDTPTKRWIGSLGPAQRVALLRQVVEEGHAQGDFHGFDATDFVEDLERRIARRNRPPAHPTHCGFI